MEHVHSVARQSTRALVWIYTVEKKFKNPLDFFPELRYN
jgi:hypothetical protein